MMERQTKNQMDEEMLIAQETQAPDAGEITAQELGANVAADVQPQDAMAEHEERMSAIREGVGELFEDGWTAQELAAFSQDETARAAIAEGKSVARAACAYLRAKGAGIAVRKRGVPTAKTIAAGETGKGNPIDAMTDEEFDAFSRRAQMAMMSGKKVRI